MDESNYILEQGERVDLPHTWNTNNDRYRGLTLYQKVVSINSEHKEGELYLEFLGANSVCKVYLNGTFIGEHRGGYSTFRFCITDKYIWDKENLLQVYVDNATTKDVSPLGGDFTIYGGLYRDVNLICTSKAHFDLCYWGTKGVLIHTEMDKNKSGVVQIESHTVASEDMEIVYEIYSQNKQLISSKRVSVRKDKISFLIQSPELWKGIESPALYLLKAYLMKDSEITDQIELHFGFRECKLTADKGFFLNEKHLFIQGVAKHQDFEGIGNAISKIHMDKDMELIKEIGANSVRLSHYQHDQYMYDLCDKEGMVVWAEIPMLSMPDNSEGLQNAENQLKELILQNIHHPSICFWGVQNEIAMNGESISMYQKVEHLNSIAHQVLPNGITASANMYYVKNNSQLNFITDMLGYNLYYGWYYGNIDDLSEWIEQFHRDNPQIALGISEYGVDSNLKFHSEDPKIKDYSEEYQALYHEITYPIICNHTFMWGSYAWNMFDFGSDIRHEGGTIGKNCKGLVSFDRETRKDSFYYYKANWSQEPFIQIANKRFVNRAKSEIDIKIYSNQTQVSLYVNGKNISTINGDKVFRFNNVRLEKGENEITATAGDCMDKAVFVLCDAPDKSYIFVDPNPEVNVKNWFTQKTGEADLFPENCYSVMDTLGDLMQNEEAWNLVKEMVPKAAARAIPGAPVTLIWVFNKMSGVYKEDYIKEVNSRLTLIHKKK
nr:glycoside hydrolase family 2 TIM barrel-domain containing protein [Anaerocolumna cellulosilytica]